MPEKQPVTWKARGAIAGRIVLALLLVNAAVPPPASAQTIEWTRQFGTSSSDAASAAAADASGVYVAGNTGGALPGQTSAGDYDAFVRKYNANGSELWTRQFGSSSSDSATAAAADASGVYVAGLTFGTLPGQTSAGGGDAFVRKYDAAGNVVWTRQFGSASFWDVASGISADASGVYVAGYTADGTLPGQTSAGGYDAFVRKYDADGNVVWTRQFGSASFDVASGISADASGVYVAGATAGTLPGQTSAGGPDAFVRKYEADGNEAWTRQFGSSSSDSATAAAADASGVYVAGSTGGTLQGQVSAGGPDAYVRKYDARGTELWTHQFGSSGFDSASGVAADASGVYVAGYTNGTLPGQTSAGTGSLDAFLGKYDDNGAELWTSQFGSSGFDAATAAAADASGVYVVGIISGALPGQTSAGGGDAFVRKLAAPTPVQLLHQLIANVVALNLKQGISNSLDAKLEAAVNALDDINQNNNVAAINALQAFVNSVEAQRGIHFSEADANSLIAAAQAIIAMLGG